MAGHSTTMARPSLKAYLTLWEKEGTILVSCCSARPSFIYITEGSELGFINDIEKYYLHWLKGHDK